MAKLFGFSIEDTDSLSPTAVSPVPPNNEDQADHYLTSGFFGSYVDLEGIYRTEFDLIKRYREMALHPEVDSAIEDIVNEAVVSDTNDAPVAIDLDNLNASDGIKKKIREEFKQIIDLLDFDAKAHEIYRNWYIDGRLYYHKVIDVKKPHEGIQEIRYIDAMKMRFIRQKKKPKNEHIRLANATNDNPMEYEFPEIEEYFEYNPKATWPTGNPSSSGMGGNKGIRMTRDSVAYCTSGLVDRNKGSTLSYLHKAIKAVNQLRMIEDSLVIYRLSRAPERRIFYIDVGNLPKVKAEQYLRDVMMRYRNKLVYDASTGEIRDDKKYMSMLEDFWLPRREGGRGTEITTLPGGQNLGEITDIKYFQDKLYRSLNVPVTRAPQNESGFNLGRSSEILRDEVKFSKFVGRLRKRFSNLFNDFLKTQLILKNIITPEDWELMSEHIQYDFLYDNHFAELKDSELFNERLTMVAAAEPYVGKYFSQDYVRRKVLRQTDEEIVEQDEIIQQEIDDGIIPDPSMMIDPEAMGQQIDPTTGAPFANGGGAPMEPDLQAAEKKMSKVADMPKGGEI